MKTKTIVTLIIMLSMSMMCEAETGTLHMDETFSNDMISISVTSVNYEGTVIQHYDRNEYVGKHDIKGRVSVEGKTYSADLDGTGSLSIQVGKVVHLQGLDDEGWFGVNGKIYENSEPGYLYKEDGNDCYGYIENGFDVDMSICYDKAPTATEPNYMVIKGLDLNGYSKYVITNTIPREKEKDDPFTLSSPALGLGYKGSKMGDVIPALFTYRDSNTRKRVVTETYPVDHDGPVICTPARIAGEPLIPSNFWTTPKVLRELEWKVNHGK